MTLRLHTNIHDVGLREFINNVAQNFLHMKRSNTYLFWDKSKYVENFLSFVRLGCMVQLEIM